MHMPVRPSWSCQECGRPWPCPTKKSDLAAEYRGARSALRIYLALFLVDAIDDFGQQHGGAVPDLHARFLRWEINSE